MADQGRAGDDALRLTWKQVPWVWSKVFEWRSIYHAEKGEYPDLNNTANMSKSCLLGRMLVEGKDPLPEPPPVCCAAPWYAYVEQTGDTTHNRHRFIADIGAPVRCLDCDEPVLMAYWREVERTGAPAVPSGSVEPGATRAPESDQVGPDLTVLQHHGEGAS